MVGAPGAELQSYFLFGSSFNVKKIIAQSCLSFAYLGKWESVAGGFQGECGAKPL